MIAALPVLMCYSIVGETAHEVIGIAMFCLFILHHILNFGWIKTLFKGKYDLRRSVNTVVNALIFLCMIGLMYSGIVISKHVFTFVYIGGSMFARTVHILCAYWGLALMSVYLGMHISQMAARIKLKNKAMVWALRIIFGVVGAVGIYEFISLKFTDYLFGKVQICIHRHKRFSCADCASISVCYGTVRKYRVYGADLSEKKEGAVAATIKEKRLEHQNRKKHPRSQTAEKKKKDTSADKSQPAAV
ncbi:DUF4405 domain-containing protein [Ruminococcus albus]|uniref:DUF4405 domain-containing protein n=1 Tax=Ruminococcus albus TaxID=1264 RepID=UPI0001E0CE86|nr:DUF4405 domain-containing protein [Ruminococcus albus]